jgi:hypothetical protein
MKNGVRKLFRGKKGRFVKDDYIGDLMDIAAASRLIIEHTAWPRVLQEDVVISGHPIPELPDIEAQARAAVEGLDEAIAELDDGIMFTWPA